MNASRRVGGIICTLLVTTGAILTSPTAISEPAPAAAPTVELVSQTPTVARGDTFDMWVRLNEVPDGGSVRLILHGRVRSRSELAASMEGDSLRSQIHSVATPIASLPVAADGSRRISLPLDAATPGGVAITSSGAYPIEIEAQDPTGNPLARLITHMLVRPDRTDESPPLAVAVVAQVDAPPALRPDGTIKLDEGALEGTPELIAALVATAAVPATLAMRPETLDALAVSSDPAQAALLDQLRAAAAGRSLLSLPYVDVSPDSLAAVGLRDELMQQLDRGRVVLADALDVQPGTATWIAGPDLDQPGLRALRAAGVRRVVVAPDQLEPLRSGVLALSLAQPFLISSDQDPAIEAMALDPRVTERLGTSVSPGLEVSRLLAELAVLWFEQPGIDRGVVVPIDRSVRGSVVQGLLAGLGAGGIFQATSLDAVFSTASPLLQPGGGRVDRALVPADPKRIDRALARTVQAVRARLASFTGVIGTDSPRADPVAAHLLLATAADLTSRERQAHVDRAAAEMDSVTGAITAPTRETITLTARDGTVPLTLGNDSGVPVNVVVHLRSPKLEFPNGGTISIALTKPTTRLDIAVRARASGAFPLTVSVTSPDGVLTLATVDYSVQSTAVSGVGLVLSIGAACFLMIWWTRHWRRTRRSEKLVASGSPAHAARNGSQAKSDPVGRQPR